MFERIQRMLIKEFIQIFRDRKMRNVLFFVPIIQALLLGYAVTNDVKHIETIVVDFDQSVMSRDFIAAFSKSGYFDILGYTESISEAQREIDKGSVMVILQINHGFQGDIEGRKTARVQLLIDGTLSNRAMITQSYARAITEQFIAKKREEKGLSIVTPIQLEARAWFNENLESRNYYVPGVVATLVTLVTLTLTSMSIVREKEIGTMEQIIVTPITRSEFILGKTLPFIIIGYIDVLAVLLVSSFWFEVPIRGSLFLLFCAVSLYLLTTLGIGLLISTISETQQQALMSAFMFYFPAVLLSGFIFPIVNMPSVIQWVTVVNPLKYFLVVIRGVFLKGVGWSILWPQLVALATMGSAMLWMAILRFQKRMG